MKNKRIWLTGASRGIGFETAKLLAKNDVTLFLSARRRESFDDVIQHFQSSEKVYIIPCDVSNSDNVKNAYAEIKEIKGGVDILINNAGIGIFKSFLETSEKDFDDTIATNLKGVFLCTKAVLPDMLENKGNGIIINILSVATQTVFEGTAIYSASKSALLAMDRVLRNEVRSKGIRIIDILPGATESDMWDEKTRAKFCDRMMQPVDVAKVIVNTIKMNMEERLITEEIIMRPIGGDL